MLPVLQDGAVNRFSFMIAGKAQVELTMAQFH